MRLFLPVEMIIFSAYARRLAYRCSGLGDVFLKEEKVL